MKNEKFEYKKIKNNLKIKIDKINDLIEIDNKILKKNEKNLYIINEKY